ncbi:hypothetical protein PFICI_00296 [Pestalotiopsis fici W106-1]|uniref:Enoyl reductase (ER) domain-containing protein n=1 Tax=Pestalotiopsis fici (strain W106-1 / CGMCC3.15140) TaxID=1229662 RepID=W3XK96_PESFW|nr:uncharacterized protein PFICI_00296 [Pestalotiopsis fici W106-1]ETS86468.1 hypothetical protein PFICI_00296 [Pestalotiopsis fici W106-1]
MNEVFNVPKSQRAIVADKNGQLVLVDDSPLPELESDMVLVKTVAVALNPVDIKMTGRLAHPGGVAGHDFAGTVVDQGSNVWTASPLKRGDRVSGAVQGVHSLTPRVGAFTEYIGATDIVLMKIPENMSFEEAASLGTGIGTMGLALFHNLQVPGYPDAPATEPTTVLVYGGSTSSGTLALQLLKLSGLKPIATASPKNFEMVKEYGAAEVFDYNSADFVANVKSYTKNSLKYVIDCVSTAETMELCYACLGRTGGRLTTLEPPPSYIHTKPKRIHLDWVLGPALHGKAIGWPPPMQREGDPELREYGKRWFTTVQGLLDQGKLKAHPLKMMAGGLEGVFEGTDLLRNNAVSGQKLIYRI